MILYVYLMQFHLSNLIILILPILAPMIKAAKADIDYQLTLQALGKTKNPISLPQNYPGCELNSVWSHLSVNEFGLIILDGNNIFVLKEQKENLLQLIHSTHCVCR